MTCLVTLFDRKLLVSKNSPKSTIFGIFNELLSTQSVNVARFARISNETFLCFSNTVILIELKWYFFDVFGVKIQVNNRFVTANPYLIFQKAKRKKNRKWSRHRLDDFRAICHKCTVQCTPRHIARTSYHKYKIHAILHNNAYCEIRSRFAPLKTFQKSRKRYDRVVWTSSILLTVL